MKLFRWLRIIVLVYALIGIAAYYLQDRFLFHPEPLSRQSKFGFTLPHQEVNIPFDESSNLNIVQFPSDRRRGVVLYFHGNKKNISWYAKYSEEFTRRGYDCWMIDYPGFGKSTGPLTEERLYAYAAQLYRLARGKYAADSIIIYGKSMGTGIAAQLAAQRDARMLVLEAPYYSIPSLVKRYLPIYPVQRMIHYKLPTHEYLARVSAPVLMFHGTDDDVIPFSQAEKLEPLLKDRDRLVTIKGGKHNNLVEYREYQASLDSALGTRE